MVLTKVTRNGDTQLTLEFFNRPRVHIEEPHRLPTPIVVSRYKEKSGYRGWPLHKQQQPTIDNDGPKRCTSTCAAWWKKRKALKFLEKQHKKDQAKLREFQKRKEEDGRRSVQEELWQAQRVKELEYFENARKQAVIEKETNDYLEKCRYKPTKTKRQKETYDHLFFFKEKENRPNVFTPMTESRHSKKEKKKPAKVAKNPSAGDIIRYEPQFLPIIQDQPKKEKPVKPKKEKPVKPKKEKPVKPKNEKSKKPPKEIIEPKHPSVTRFSVKQRKKEPLSTRFVNCFYKFCCELYCWLTVLFLIGIALIHLL